MIAIRYRLFLSLILLLPLLFMACTANDNDDNSAEDNGDDDTTTDDDADDDAGDDDANDAIFAQVRQFMTDQLAANQVPGGAIAIVLDGQLAYTAGIGVKENGTTDPVDADTRFIVCSISKMLTAGGLMTLWDEGRLDLDSPVTDYVPYFQLRDPFDPSELTTHMLLTHTAGLPDYLEENCATDPGALSRWFRNHTEQPLWSPPGRLWNYANLGYSLAGLVLEEISGTPFTEAMQQRIFDPLGMNRLTYDPLAAMADNFSTGHTMKWDGSLAKNNFDDFGCAIAWPPGILFGSVVDLARYAEMQLAGGGEVLSAEAVARMQSPLAAMHSTPDDYYGYGMIPNDYKGVRMVWHDGGIEGFTTFWMIVPERNFGAVVFVNADYYYPADVALKAADLFLQLPDVEPPDYSTPPETWGKYVGTYYDPFELGTIEVYQDAELRLWAKLVDIFGVTVELIQYAADTFIVTYHDIGLIGATFFLDDADQGEYFVTRVGVGKRVEDELLRPPPLNQPWSFEAWLTRINRLAATR